MAVQGRALRFEDHHAKQHAGGLIAILLTRKGADRCRRRRALSAGAVALAIAAPNHDRIDSQPTPPPMAALHAAVHITVLHA